MTSGRPIGFRTGSMRHKIVIQSASEVVSVDGFMTKTWSALWSNVPAEYEDVSGGETRRGKQVQAGATAVFRFRYLAGVTAMCRILFDGTYWGIVNVTPVDMQTRYIEVQAASIANT